MNNNKPTLSTTLLRALGLSAHIAPRFHRRPGSHGVKQPQQFAWVALCLALVLTGMARATAQDEVNAAMAGSGAVQVFQKRNLLGESEFFGFKPYNLTAQVGVIIYPGAFVDPRAYAPLARHFADLGYPAAVLTPPFNFAYLSTGWADKPMKYWGNAVRKWVVVGHSLGGSVAATYANHHDNPGDKLGALVLLASYPTNILGLITDNLSNDPYRVTSIYGTKDGLTSQADIDKSKALLPSSTRFVPVWGGNHTQFYYSDTLQSKDNPADISRSAQQAVIQQEIQWLLDRI